MNFNKDNLITINKNEIKKNSKVIKIDDMYFLIGDTISSVNNVEYYKCVAVGTDGNKHDYSTQEKPTVWSGKKLIWNTKIETIKNPDEIILNISNLPDDNYNGDYSLTDETKDKSGTDRIWKNENGIYLGFLLDQWYLTDVDPSEINGADDFYYYNYYPDQYIIPENPWDALYWESINSNTVNITFEQIENTGTTETKIIKYLDFENTITTGLNCTEGFIPEIDKIYDSEAMSQVTLYQKQ